MEEGTAGAEAQAPPPPHNEDPALITDTIQTATVFFQKYGWFVVALVFIALYIKRVLDPQIQQWYNRGKEAITAKKTDNAAAMQQYEAMERARTRMQDQLDQQALEFAERERQREELKRQEKLSQWNALNQGKGRRQQPTTSSSSLSSTSTSPPATSGERPKKEKRPLRPEYNPLMGSDSGGVCYRPTRRGGGG